MLVLVGMTPIAGRAHVEGTHATTSPHRLIVNGEPRRIQTVAKGEAVYIDLLDLFAAYGWAPCTGNDPRCVQAPAGRRKWTSADVIEQNGREFMELQALRRRFNLSAGLDRSRSILYVLPLRPIENESTAGPNIPIAGKNYGPFDPAGIPMKRQGLKGVQYNPLVVMEYASVYFIRYLDSGNHDYRSAFFRMAQWLMKALRPLKSSGRSKAWIYDFDWPPLAAAPWPSGIAQAEGASILMDAYMITGDPHYRRSAEAAMNLLKVRVKDGGVLSTDIHGRNPFFEEYPSDPPSRVLGGFMDTLIVAERYLQYVNDPELERLTRRGIQSVASTLPAYDAPDLLDSRYALSEEMLFRLVTDNAQIRDRHPVAEIRISPPADRPFTLKLGTPESATRPGYHVAEMPSTDWSKPHLEDGVMVRDFAEVGGRSRHAAFFVRLTGYLPERAQQVGILYLDISREPVHFEIYSRVWQRYVRLGDFECRNDGRWKWLSVRVTPETVGQSGFGLTAGGAYPTMHISWLRQLYELSGDEVFDTYANKWTDYLSKRAEADRLLRESTRYADTQPEDAQKRLLAALQLRVIFPEASAALTSLKFPRNWVAAADTTEHTAFQNVPYSLDAALDGRRDTYAAGVGASPAMVTFDLRAPRMISRLQILWFDATSYPPDFSLEAYDGNEWRLLAGETDWRPEQAAAWVKNLAVPIVATKVRLCVTRYTGQQRLLMRDIALWGPE